MVRRRTLPGLIEELKAEIKRRRPAEPEQPEVKESKQGYGEEVFDPGDLLQPIVLSTPADLDSWLAGIREKLAGLLKSNKRIRIKGR